MPGGVNTAGQPISTGGGTIVPQGGAKGTPVPQVVGQQPGAPPLTVNPTGNASNPTTTVDMNKVQPTTMSSANISENTIPQNNQTLAGLTAANPTSAQNNNIQNNRDSGGTYQGEDGNQYYNFDSTPVSGQAGTASMISGTQIPSTGDPATDANLKMMSDMTAKMDATSAAAIANIQSTYQGLIAQQQQTNAGAEASLNALLLSGGSNRTASGGGFSQSQVSFGLQKISDLVDKENSAVLAAQQAQQQNDYQQLDKQLSLADEIRKEKQIEITKQNDALVAAKTQNAKDNAITGQMDAGLSDPKAIFDALQKQGMDTITLKDVTDTVNSLNTLKDNPLTSTAITWASDFLKNGGDQATANKAIAMAQTDPTGALSLLSGGLSDPLKAQTDKLDLEQKQANLANTKANTAKTQTDTQIARDNAQASTSPEPGTAQYKVAQDLAYGNLTMQQFRTLYSYSRNINAKLGIYQLASQLNPNFNPAAFELGYTFASNPKVRQQVTSLDNVSNVMPNVIAASDAATRTGTGLNDVVIKGGVMIGNSTYSNMRLARTAFADELSGALGYGGATDMSREMGFDMTDPGLSAQQFKDGMTNIVQPFIESKRSVLVNAMGQYGNVVNNQSSGAAGQGAGAVKLKDPNTGEVRSFSKMSPADFQEATKSGYTVVQ